MLFHDLLDAEVFPSDWSVVRMAVTKVMLKTMQELAKPLLVYFKVRNVLTIIHITDIRPYAYGRTLI